VFWRNEQIRGTDEPAERATTPGGVFSRRFLKETLASSNGAEAVMVFWRNEQIRGTDEPAERATTPSGALFTRISSRNRQFERRSRASVKHELFEQIRYTRNDAEHVTLFLRNGEICGTNASRNERRRRTERFRVDFGRVAKRARDAVLAKPTICGTSTDAE